ncbi:MAG: von Willebrand factor type A domain-containing protein [Ferruginibacter sp.]
MIKRFAHILLLLFALQAKGQYYLRGEVRDEKNQPLTNVRIILLSSHYTYSSGAGGGFGITTNVLNDSLQLSLEGYETRTVKVRADQWQQLTLNVLSSTSSRNRPKLISVTKDLNRTTRLRWLVNDETYFQLVENEHVDASKFPNTGFSLNVNKASYSNVRRFLNMQSAVPPDAVRTEELVNYFNLHYHEPKPGDIFNMETQLSSCPWDAGRQLLFLNINARKLDMNRIPPGNFVFLIDVSGSMDLPNRLPLLKAAFQLLVKNLRTIDTVSIVTYGGGVSIKLQPTGGNEKEKILKAIEELEANGDTPGEAAIMTAYKLAETTFNKDGNNRVILATDGDFNVGQTSEKALEELISREKQTGVYLTCLGVGMGNFKDSKLQALAKRGNGNFAYLDDINEAEKVLVKELTQTFYAVADDVFMNIRFNPAQVKQYRLIGFDNRRDAVADNNLDMEGGEIGSGNSVIAVFEIIRDSAGSNQSAMDTTIANLSLQYSLCNDTVHKELNMVCPDNYVEFRNLDREYRFATAVLMFSLKLKQSKYIKNADWEDIETIGVDAYDINNYLQTEFLTLVGKAKKLYTTRKKKKKGED